VTGSKTAAPGIPDLATALGYPKPPRRIVQPLFNVDARALRQMMDEAHPGDGIRWHGLLQNLAEDLPSTDIQPDLMRWFVPHLFECWQSAWHTEEAWGFLDRFHAAVLARPGLIEDTLGARAQALVEDVVVSTSIARCRESSGPDHIVLGWYPTVVTLTAAWPAVGRRTWDGWVERAGYDPGAAWSLIGFWAHLTWPVDHNLLDGPGYRRWRPWHHALLSSTSHRWSPSALDALREQIDPLARGRQMSECFTCLRATPHHEMAELLCAEISESPRASQRAADLIGLLSTPGGERWWPDALR